jgi:hypothetical protein
VAPASARRLPEALAGPSVPGSKYSFIVEVHIATARSHGPGRWIVSKALEQHFCIADETEIRQ